MADSIPYTTIMERVKNDIDYIAEQAYAEGYNSAKAEIALSGEYERAYKRGKEDAERKRGFWFALEKGDKGYSAGDFKCSVCGKPNASFYIKPNFCPYCGADMRGAKNERNT